MLPQRVQKGQPITADLLNKIIDSVRECQLQSGVGYSFSRSAGGTTLSIKATKQGGGAIASPCPFDVSASETSSGLDIYIACGTINGLLPSNIFEKIATVTSGKKYIVIDCESNGKNVTSASWSIKNNFPVPAVPTIDVAPSTFGILVAVVSGSSVIKTIPCSNLQAKIGLSIQEDKAIYSAGQRNYSQYYQWIY